MALKWESNPIEQGAATATDDAGRLYTIERNTVSIRDESANWRLEVHVENLAQARRWATQMEKALGFITGYGAVRNYSFEHGSARFARRGIQLWNGRVESIGPDNPSASPNEIVYHMIDDQYGEDRDDYFRDQFMQDFELEDIDISIRVGSIRPANRSE